LATVAYREAGMSLPPADIPAVVVELCNWLERIMHNVNDTKKQEAVVPLIQLYLEQKIEQEKINPGTAERSA